MFTKQNILIGLVGIALILSVIGLVGGNQSVPTLGGVTNLDALTLDNGNLIVTNGTITASGSISATGGTTIGSAGSAVSTLIFGQLGPSSCTGTATQAIGAQTTYTCTVSGALTNDRIFVTLASTTPSWVLLSNAYASTTGSNDVRVVLFNASSTGAAATATTTGAKYLIVR